MKSLLGLFALLSLLFMILPSQQKCFVLQGKIVCCDRYGYCM